MASPNIQPIYRWYCDQDEVGLPGEFDYFVIEMNQRELSFMDWVFEVFSVVFLVYFGYNSSQKGVKG